MLTCNSFFNLTEIPYRDLFFATDYAWEPLNKLNDFLQDHPFDSPLSGSATNNTPLRETLVLHDGNVYGAENFTLEFGDTCKGGLSVHHNGSTLVGASVIMAGATLAGQQLEIGCGVLIEAGATIKSPAIIGDCTEIRQGAYLRGNVICGRSCVLGHTTEIKHAIFLDDAKAGHFNYIGDSILGNNTNLGAGTKFANLRFIKGNIEIDDGNSLIDTGRRKIGAILGDRVQTGCNSVTNPGTLLGKGSFVMPNANVSAGYHKPNSVIRK